MVRSVRIIGWSTALLSIIIILSEFSNLLTNPMEQVSMVFQMFPQVKSRHGCNDGYISIQPHVVGLYNYIFLVCVVWINPIYPLSGNRQNDA